MNRLYIFSYYYALAHVGTTTTTTCQGGGDVLPSSSTAALRRGMASMAGTTPAAVASSYGRGASFLFFHSAHTMARRHSHAGRRPTYQEITEALSTLGISSVDVSEKEIKKRYRELVKKNHPDAGGDEQVMARVTVAYERLSSLTKREKEEYKMQLKMYRGGSYHSSSTNPYAAQRRPGFDPFASGSSSSSNSNSNNSQYYQEGPNAAYTRQQQAYWSYYQRQQQQYNDSNSHRGPFSQSPFGMYAQFTRGRFVPTGTLFVQGLALYLFFSIFFLFLYRSYRDYKHEDGWKMSESLARHEQMQELQRIRQELKDRAAMALAAQQQQGSGSGHPNAAGDDLSAFLQQRNPRVGDTTEARALEYARQRRLMLMEEQRSSAHLQNLPELKGWPKIKEEEGKIVKRAQDPPGVVFYEPRREDARNRQVLNRRRSVATDDTAAVPHTATAAINLHQPPSNGTDPSSDPVPPESNVSSVIAAPVSSNAEAREAIHSIFAAIKESQQAATATK